MNQYVGSITQKLDRLPFSRWHLFMVIALGTIWIFDGYEVTLLSLFSGHIIDDYSESDFKMLVTCYQIGCIVGSIGFGFFAYFYGRKMVFIVMYFIILGDSCDLCDRNFVFYDPFFFLFVCYGKVFNWN